MEQPEVCLLRRTYTKPKLNELTIEEAKLLLQAHSSAGNHDTAELLKLLGDSEAE